MSFVILVLVGCPSFVCIVLSCLVQSFRLSVIQWTICLVSFSFNFLYAFVYKEFIFRILFNPSIRVYHE